MSNYQALPETHVSIVKMRRPNCDFTRKAMLFRLTRLRRGAKGIALVFALMLAICVLTACQPTPEEPIVVNRNDGVLESAIAATPAPAAHYDAPETWTLDAFEANARLTVSVDAQVEVPDTGAFPVYEFVSGSFTQEQADKIIGYFYGDATLYEARQPMTKSQLEEMLVRAKLAYQEALAGATNEAGNTKWENTPEEMLESIEALEARIEAAPETNEVQISGGQLEMVQLMGDTRPHEMLYVAPDLSRKDTRYLQISNAGEGAFGSAIGLIDGRRYYPTQDTASVTQAPGIETTPGQAAQLVQDMLDGFGFGFMEVSRVLAGQMIESGEAVRDDLAGGYRVECIRRAGDFLVTTMSDGYRASKEDGTLTQEEMQELYAYYWPPETLNVYVDDTGVTAIEWDAYGEIASTISENVTLLPFEELAAPFKSAVSAQYSWMVEEGAPERGNEIDITRVALSMARIQVKDAPGRWQLVPAWEFYGTFTYYDEEGTARTSDYSTRSLLTLNAVDGSAIQ
jgi:hypothetical protein